MSDSQGYPQETLNFPDCLIDGNLVEGVVDFFMSNKGGMNEAEMLHHLIEVVVRLHLHRAKFGLSSTDGVNLNQELSKATRGLSSKNQDTPKPKKWSFGWVANGCVLK